MVILDQKAVQNGGRIAIDGITAGARHNRSGTCELKIKSVTVQDFGKWVCTLVSQGGAVSRGALEIQ